MHLNQTPARTVIVGAGQAGAAAAVHLRQLGYQGSILLLGEEAVAPYHRPPLSKGMLKGEADVESIQLYPSVRYGQEKIDLRLDCCAAEIDRSAKSVVLANGERVPYDALILATGARPRALTIPGSGLEGVHQLRSVAHVEGLKAALGPASKLVIIGGGYIGLEVAAAARGAGADVVVLEREHRVLARVAGEPLSRFFESCHRDRGVAIHTSVRVYRLEADSNGQVQAVVTENGERYACDAVLVGVGAQANDDLAIVAGLVCDNGVVVDESARTSDSSIYAIGDVTNRLLPFSGGRRSRLESVANALEQARQAACAIVGKPQPTAEVPWFWSDQYDIKLQIAGLAHDADQTIVRGHPGQGPFAIFYVQGDRILAVEAINAPAEFMAGRMFISQKRAVDPQKLADVRIAMKNVTV